MRKTFLLVILLVLSYCSFAEGETEGWGDIDNVWFWKPFEAREAFALYSMPSHSSEKVGMVEKGKLLSLLDRKDGWGWYLLRETSPPYRKGWVSGGDEDKDAVDYKALPLCSTYFISEDPDDSLDDHHLFCRADKMPYFTIITDMAVAEVGKVSDKVIDLYALGYEDVYFFSSPEKEGAYSVCVGTFKSESEAERTKKELETNDYVPLVYTVTANR